MAKDLYAVLGLSKGASVDEVKQAYRKLSKEWHPDRHKGDKSAEHKFKEINEAYEVLGNEKKKQTYDQFGSTGGPGGAGFGAEGFGFDFSSGFGGFGDLFRAMRDMAEQQAATIQYNVRLPVVDAILGTTLRIPHKDGDIEVTIPPGTQFGDQFVVRGKGAKTRGGHVGDVIVTVIIDIPKKLSREERKLMEEWKARGGY